MAAKKKATKAPARKAPAKKAPGKKAPAKKAPGKKAPAKKAAAKGSAKKAAAVKKAPSKKPTTKKSPAKRGATKKATPTVQGRTPSRPAPRVRVKKPAGRAQVKSATVVTFPAASTERLPQLTDKHAPVDDFTSSGDELLDIFMRYDRDRTGNIDRREFARLLEALGQNVTDMELEIALDEVDTNRSGKISFVEFRSWWLSR